jgi:uncharacterized protein (TIGR03067 family)
MILIPVSIALIFASGCATPTKPNSTVLEGSWNGHDITPGREGTASLLVSGHTLEFHGADPNDWLKGTFTLRDDTNPRQCNGVVIECPQADYVGKNFYSIYKIENGTLTATGNEPGNTNIPSAFDDPASRQLIFKHDQ